MKYKNDKLIKKFICLMKRAGFSPEEFLFNSLPYVNGMTKIVEKVNRSLTGLQPMNVLDFGCGTGLTTFILAEKNKVDGIDVFSDINETQHVFLKKGIESQINLWKTLSEDNKNIIFKMYDGRNIPFDKKFNMIFMHAVFEHIPDEDLRGVLDQIYQKLEKYGHLVICRTPNKFAWTEFITGAHSRKYSKKELLGYFNNKYYLRYYAKTDFFPEISSGFIQTFINYLYPVTSNIEKIINLSPLKIFSHHHFMILQKK